MNCNKMIEWIGTHHVGISSKTMWCALMGVAKQGDKSYDGFNTPQDGYDFRRCYDLVEFCEVTKDDLQKVVEAFPCYKPIIERWNLLVSLCLREDYKDIYKILQGL